MSSINLGSILISASCMIHLPLVCHTDVVRVSINSQVPHPTEDTLKKNPSILGLL